MNMRCSFSTESEAYDRREGSNRINFLYDTLERCHVYIPPSLVLTQQILLVHNLDSKLRVPTVTPASPDKRVSGEGIQSERDSCGKGWYREQ